MAKYEDILEEIRKRTQLANTELNNVQDAINYGQSNGRSYESLDTQLKNSRAITRDYAANLKRIADRNNIAYSNTEELTPTLSSLASKNINKKAWEQDSKLPINIVDIAKRNEQELQNEKKKFNETIGNTQEYKDYQYRINKLNPTLRYARDVAELNEKGVSGLDKVFSPLISGLDNIKTSGTFKQDNNSRVMLPTLNDLKTQKATENANWLYKGYADISQSVGNMLPGIAASAINPALGSALFFGNTYQNAKNQALLEGYDESSASNYGVINATLELGVGKVLGGTTALLGKSPVSKLIGDKITSKLIVNPAINSAISDMMSEFGEEYIQEWLDPKVKAYILDKKDLAEAWESSKFFDKQNFYAGLLGALSAGITNTPGTIRQNSALNSEFEKIVDTLQKDGNEKLTKEQLKQLKKTYYKEYNKALKNDTEIDYENISNKLTNENRTEQSLTNNIEELKEQQKQTTDNKLKQELASEINSLEKQLEKQGTRILEETEAKKQGMINNFKEYLEENNITNPTQQDIDDSIIDLLGYDNDLDYTDTLKEEKLYNQYVKEYMKENGIPFNNTQSLKEVKLPTRETITKEELEELDSLKTLNDITDLSREDQDRLDYLEKKQQGYTERYPGLKKVTDFKEISREYGKYRDLDNFDRTLLRDAESMIKGYRNTERRTKDEWLSIARYIGSNFKGNSEELQKYAIQSWFAAAPNQKGQLNRQGKGYVDFKIQEWINSMYDGARVGDLDKPSVPKKQTILPMAREDNVLKVNANEIADFMNGINGNQRGWAKTATESDVLKDKVLIKDLDANKLNYVVESNQKSVDTANNHLNTYGYEKSLEDVKSLLRSDKLPKASDVALAERVLQEAVRNGDTKTAQDLVMDIAILGTDLGKATQALSIIKRLTPEGQLQMYTKIIQRAKSRGEKSFQNVEITPEMVQKILDAYKSDGTYDQQDLNNRVESFKQDIADQMKTTAGEKINAWRYLAMLGNPKTHIRNIVSNVAMNGTIKVKNAVARTLESVLPIENRTKTWKKASNFIKNYAETTANEMKGIITGENKYNEKSSIESKKQIFKNKTLEKISDFNSNALEAEDWFFSKRAFKSNLEEYLTANGINTQEDIESRPEVVEKAKNYAKEQAEIATFRQYSKLAAQINNLEKNNKLARFFIEATVPFKKTPINVAKAGVKYSPLGLIKSLSYDIYQVKQGNMEASQLIDNISQGLTGTSLAILGYALAKNGILNGGGDDDKEGKYDTQLGDNQYSLKIGDKSYSISWLSPVAMPLLVGANAFEQLEEKEEWDMNVVSETLAKTLDPLNEMSFMQGLTNALSSYDKGVEKLAGIGESVAQNYVGQFFPTIFSQFASTIDDKKRSTKASANSTYKFGEQTLRSVMYKLPGLRQQLEVATDVWGNEKEQADNIIQRAYESFLAPYSTTKNITSDLDKEIKSIYNKTNETGVIPSVPYSYIKYKDETYRMSANEYTKYKKTFGQNANKYLNNLISSNSYKNASDDDKAKMIKNTYDYAKAEANEEYFKSQSINYTSDTLKELNALKKIGINDKSLSEYISNKTLASTIKSNSQLSANEKHKKIADNLIKSNLNDKQLAYLYGKYYSTDDKLNNLVELNIPIKEFIKLNSQDIESDYNERTGKTISNSKKNKVINYVNSLNLSIPQKAILIKSQYNTYKDYDNQIVNYVNNLNKSINDKKVILKSIGFDNYDNDVINYINSQNMSIKDKEKKLKSLGFTIRDGRVYK